MKPRELVEAVTDRPYCKRERGQRLARVPASRGEGTLSRLHHREEIERIEAPIDQTKLL